MMTCRVLGLGRPLVATQHCRHGALALGIGIRAQAVFPCVAIRPRPVQGGAQVRFLSLVSHVALVHWMCVRRSGCHAPFGVLSRVVSRHLHCLLHTGSIAALSVLRATRPGRCIARSRHWARPSRRAFPCCSLSGGAAGFAAGRS